MKSLEQIENDYLRDIFYFFCDEYKRMLKFDKHNESHRTNLRNLIYDQIESRFGQKIIDLEVQINIHPLNQIRDSKIDNIITDDIINIQNDNITLMIQRLKANPILIFEYII